MAKRQVFYSFHFDNDVMRVQQIRNMGIVEGDQPVAANEWEQFQRRTGVSRSGSMTTCVTVHVSLF